MKNYYLCSQRVIDTMKPEEVSKPFLTGFKDDTDKYYVAVLDYDKAVAHYSTNESEEDDLGFMFRECSPGCIDVSKVAYKGFKAGLWVEFCNKTGLSTERNIAMCIRNFADEKGLTPIELINKIANEKTS